MCSRLSAARLTDTIEAGSDCLTRCVGKFLGNGLDVLECHLLRDLHLVIVGQGARSQRRVLLALVLVRLGRRSAKVPKLREDLAALVVDALGDLLPPGDLRLVPDTRGELVGARAGRDERRFGDEQAALRGALLVVLALRVLLGRVELVAHPGQRCENDAVLELVGADAHRREETGRSCLGHVEDAGLGLCFKPARPGRSVGIDWEKRRSSKALDLYATSTTPWHLLACVESFIGTPGTGKWRCIPPTMTPNQPRGTTSLNAVTPNAISVDATAEKCVAEHADFLASAPRLRR